MVSVFLFYFYFFRILYFPLLLLSDQKKKRRGCAHKEKSHMRAVRKFKVKTIFRSWHSECHYHFCTKAQIRYFLSLPVCVCVFECATHTYHLWLVEFPWRHLIWIHFRFYFCSDSYRSPLIQSRDNRSVRWYSLPCTPFIATISLSSVNIH